MQQLARSFSTVEFDAAHRIDSFLSHATTRVVIKEIVAVSGETEVDLRQTDFAIARGRLKPGAEVAQGEFVGAKRLELDGVSAQVRDGVNASIDATPERDG